MPEGPLFSFKSDVHEFGTDEDGDPYARSAISALVRNTSKVAA